MASVQLCESRKGWIISAGELRSADVKRVTVNAAHMQIASNSSRAGAHWRFTSRTESTRVWQKVMSDILEAPATTF